MTNGEHGGSAVSGHLYIMLSAGTFLDSAQLYTMWGNSGDFLNISFIELKAVFKLGKSHNLLLEQNTTKFVAQNNTNLSHSSLRQAAEWFSLALSSASQR